MGNSCEFQFFDLNSTLESKPTLGPKLDLSHILESILVPVPFAFEPKSTTPSSYIPMLDLISPL